MSSQKEFVLQKVEGVKESLDLFYQQKNREAYNRFATEIGAITETVDTLFVYKTEHEGFPMDETKIANMLKEAMEALEEGDMILMADILQYDFVEYIESLLEQME